MKTRHRLYHMLCCGATLDTAIPGVRWFIYLTIHVNRRSHLIRMSELPRGARSRHHRVQYSPWFVSPYIPVLYTSIQLKEVLSEKNLGYNMGTSSLVIDEFRPILALCGTAQLSRGVHTAPSKCEVSPH